MPSPLFQPDAGTPTGLLAHKHAVIFGAGGAIGTALCASLPCKVSPFRCQDATQTQGLS